MSETKLKNIKNIGLTAEISSDCEYVDMIILWIHLWQVDV